MANDIIDIIVTDNSDNVQINATPNLVTINVSNTSGNIIGSNYYLASTYSALPITGDTTTLYVINDTSLMYRWNGSAYAQINSSAVVAWGQITGSLANQTDLQNALNAKAPLASPTFTGTVSGITKSMVGLGNVDNTTDLLKPISTATQSALNLKYDASNPAGYTTNVGTVTSVGGTGTVSGLSLSGSVTTSGNLTLGGTLSLTSGNVTTALGYTPYNATNPSGYISGITSGQVTTALGYTPENSANKGIANGYASLDGGGLVPSTQLPSYVDDVLEYTNLATFPASGTTGKIYVALDTNKIYRWSGATYIEVSPTVGTIWGGITGTLSNQTDLQNALNLKYNTPTGTTAQYVAGDGSLIAFPVAGQSGTIVRLVRNSTGATLTKGTVVYISGATGNNPIVSKAIATGDSTSAQTFGLLQADIANNATGYAVTMGDLIGLDTSAFTEGQQLYLSGTVAGTYTATKQYAPIHLVYIGIITRSHPTLGQIEVKIQNGYELDEIHDVSAQNPANNDIIAFNTTSGLWEKKSIATTLGFTPVTNARTITINGTALDLTANRSYSVGTVTSVSALTLGTTGTDVSSTVATGTTTPVITLNIPTASASNRGALSSADWTTFNNKANALSGTANKVAKFTSTTAIGDSSITDTGSLVTIANPLTLSGSVTGVGNLSNYTVTASAGSATSKKITSTLVASANSDVLVGLDINPTFTTGSFTGVSKLGLRLQSIVQFGISIFGTAEIKNLAGNGNTDFLGGSANTGSVNFYGGPSFNDGAGVSVTGNLNTNPSSIIFYKNGFSAIGRFFASGNLTLQNGGTFTDAGYRLDVAGTTRFQGTTASDTAPLGSELAGVTGTGTNWTLAGTNLNVGGYTHTTGSVVPLTTSLAAVSGTYYQITYTITGRTAGSITIAYGGTSIGASATGATGPLASSTAVLTITPTTDFDGTVVLSIKSIGQSSASSNFANSAGTSIIEVRAGSDTSNTFIGLQAGRRNTTGITNTFIGTSSGPVNTTGSNNSFFGGAAGLTNTIGSSNSFFGSFAGYANTIGGSNTFVGASAGQNNTTGGNNSFVGVSAGSSNITGTFNTFLGNSAGQYSNGSYNTSTGNASLQSNSSGNQNTAIGQGASQANTTGSFNISVGQIALQNNTSGSSNIALGQQAGRYISDGATGNSITNTSIYIGTNTKALANNQSNQIVIGDSATGLGSNTTVLGNSSTVTTAIYGNLVLGSTTDAGYKLDVTGTARVSGAATFLSSVSATSYNATTQNIFAVDGTERMRITAAGNVGIGTTSPTNPLHVETTGADLGIQIYRNVASDGGSAPLFLSHKNTAGTVNTVNVEALGAGHMVFRTGATGLATFGTERMRITSGGGVLIGKTAEDNTTRGIFFRQASWSSFSNDGDTVMILNRNTNNGTILEFKYAGTVVGSISTNANSLPSDLNFKKDISNISIGLNLINKLRPVNYRHKIDTDNEPLSNGIIAQEMENALLECGIEKNSLLMLQHKPNEDKTQSEYWVDYQKMIPILIKGIQEQQSQIEELKTLLKA